MTTMSISRAFTSRRFRSGNEAADGSPSSSQRRSAPKGQIQRHKISAPVQLIHTTNMLSYNAPDLPRPSRSNSTNTVSTQSDDEPDFIMMGSESTPPTSPEVSASECSLSPEPNHLTSYFKAPANSSSRSPAPPPAIPERSPSHTKKNSFDAIARSRSRSLSRTSRDSERSASRTAFSRPPSSSTRASSASRTPSPHSQKQATPSPLAATKPRTSDDEHPFGQELAQVTELAEEYTADTLDTIDEDQRYLASRGLVRLSADDYLGGDIQDLASSFLPELNRNLSTAPVWI